MCVSNEETSGLYLKEGNQVPRIQLEFQYALNLLNATRFKNRHNIRKLMSGEWQSRPKHEKTILNTSV